MLFKLPNMSTLQNIDAATCASVAAVLLLATRPVSALTGLTVDLLHDAGTILVLFALLFTIAGLARRPVPGLALVLIAGNAVWVIASIVLLTSSAVALESIGSVLVLLQAIAVSILTGAEIMAWRGVRLAKAHARRLEA